MTRTSEVWPHGAPAWAHVSTPDDAASRTFYSELVGWEIAPGDPEFHGYAMAMYIVEHELAEERLRQSQRVFRWLAKSGINAADCQTISTGRDADGDVCLMIEMADLASKAEERDE